LSVCVLVCIDFTGWFVCALGGGGEGWVGWVFLWRWLQGSHLPVMWHQVLPGQRWGQLHRTPAGGM